MEALSLCIALICRATSFKLHVMIILEKEEVNSSDNSPKYLLSIMYYVARYLHNTKVINNITEVSFKYSLLLREIKRSTEITTWKLLNQYAMYTLRAQIFTCTILSDFGGQNLACIKV